MIVYDNTEDIHDESSVLDTSQADIYTHSYWYYYIYWYIYSDIYTGIYMFTDIYICHWYINFTFSNFKIIGFLKIWKLKSLFAKYIVYGRGLNRWMRRESGDNGDDGDCGEVASLCYLYSFIFHLLWTFIFFSARCRKKWLSAYAIWDFFCTFERWSGSKIAVVTTSNRKLKS